MCDTAARSPARLLAAFFLVLISFRVVFPKSSFARHCHTGAKEKGLVRSEGKEYVVQDGDVVLFRFNV